MLDFACVLKYSTISVLYIYCGQSRFLRKQIPSSGVNYLYVWGSTKVIIKVLDFIMHFIVLYIHT